jgi:microcystin degradation protein MlrC
MSAVALARATARSLGRLAIGGAGRVAVTDPAYVREALGPRPDRAAFSSQAIRPDDYDLIVVKSGDHFQLSFDGVATPLKALTRGVGAYAPGAFAFRRRGPTYPEDQVTFEAEPRQARRPVGAVSATRVAAAER